MKHSKKKKSEKVSHGLLYTLQGIDFGKAKNKNYFVENLSMLLSSGMTVNDAIESISEEIRSISMKRKLDILRSDIENGSPLWKAFEKTGMFSPHTIALVRIGEESGNLSQNLKLLASQEEKERVFKSKIRTAMLYPGFVFGVTVTVGLLIMWFILPRLTGIFGQLHIELPAITKALIAFGSFLGDYGVFVIPLFFVFIFFIIFILFYNKGTRHIGQNILFATPGVGKLLREIELFRFGYLLGTLLEAGIPIQNSIESLEKAVTFKKYKEFYAFLKKSIQEGNSFAKSFASYKKSKKFIPKTIQGLIVAGERSGSLSETLLKFSARFEAKIEDSTKSLAVIFEPVLLVIVWLGVVVVALSVVLPIYSLIGGLNN